MNVHPVAPASHETDYAAILRRRWWEVMLGGLLGVAVAATVSLALPPQYVSTALVQVLPTGISDGTSLTNGRTQGSVNLDTEAQLVTSTPVATRASALLKETYSPTDVQDNLDVTVPANTQILSIAYTGPSASQAQQGAGAFAQAYLENRTSTATTQQSLQIKPIQDQVTALTNQLRDVAGKLATLPAGSPDRAFAAAQQDVVGRQISALSSQLSALQATPVTPGQVITVPDLPTSASSPIWLLNLGTGLVAGLLLGVVVVLARVRRRRITRARDVGSALHLPVVSLPSVGLAGSIATRQAYQELSNAILLGEMGRPSVVLVTAVGSTSRGGDVAAGLADVLAVAGLSVALIDADFGAGKPDGVGLADVLLDGRPVLDVAQLSASSPPYQFVTAGQRGPDAAHLLQVERLRPAVLELLQTCEIVVLAAPSTTSGHQAQTLAGLAQAAVLVVQAGDSRLAEVRVIASELEVNGSRVLGAVLLTKGRPTLASGSAHGLDTKAVTTTQGLTADRDLVPDRVAPSRRPVAAVNNVEAALPEGSSSRTDGSALRQ